MKSPQPVRIGLYARISLDKDGSQTATARQLQDARAHAERYGWTVADVYEDVDISAFDARAKRPEFERLIQSLRDGSVDGVLVWKLDRLSRQQKDLARVLEACEKNRGFVASVTEPIDTREPHGQFVAELLVAQARMESADTSARQKRKAQEHKETGKPHIGGHRLFGYQRDFGGVVAEEAAIIREARDRLFAGESLRSVCFDLEGRGVKSTAGNAIRPQLFKRTLTSAAIAGLREGDGKVYPGSWQAIVSEEDLRKLRLLLRRRVGVPRDSPARKYLLSGFVRCGRCGGRMAGHAQRTYRRYLCQKDPGAPNCGSMAVRAEAIEGVVAELVFQSVDDDALRAALASGPSPDDGLLEAIRRDELSLEELSKDFYVEKLLTREEFLASRGDLRARLEANQSRLAQRSKANVLAPFAGRAEVLRTAWAAGSLEWRRSVVGALLEAVEVLPGKPGRLPFQVERVRPIWKV